MELSAAALRYERERKDLGDEFLVAVDEAIRSIAANPLLFGLYEALPENQRFRRFRMRRFPYVLVYECREEGVVIIAAAHTSRTPGYWVRRTEDEGGGNRGIIVGQ